MSMNRVEISGNLTRDPERRETNGGTTILSYGVAVNDRRKNPQTGEWEDVANFIDCLTFGRQAEVLAPMLHKGDKVAIAGRLRYSSWERDGQRRSKLEVVTEEVELMARRDGGRKPQQQGRNEGRVVAPGVYQPALNAQQQADDDGIPF